VRRYLSSSLFFVWCVQPHAQANGTGQPKEFFSHPDSLCSALEDAGIHPGAWRQIGLGFFSDQSEHSVPGPYFCEYPQWVAHSLTGTPSLAGTQTVRPPGPDTNLVYRVSGDSQKRADIISIAVTVHRPSAMESGEQDLERQISQLFKTINHRQPPGLFQSIKRRQYFRSRQPYGIVWFNLVVPDHHNVDDQTLWFRRYE
jgi:hypothetical protein